MAPSDVWIVIDGHEENQQAEWERARWICFFVHIHSPVKKPAKSPQEILPLPWDKGTTVKRARNPKEVWEEWHRMKEAKKKK